MANLSDIITPTNVVTDTSTSTLTNKTLTAPVLTTPDLGTPSALVLTNATGTLTSPIFVTPALGTPASGVMTSVTGLPLTTGVTGTLPVANGGTGATTLTANNVVLGNGTSAVQVVAPSTSGNVLTSDGTTWASTPAGGGTTSTADVSVSGGYQYTVTGVPSTATHIWINIRNFKGPSGRTYIRLGTSGGIVITGYSSSAAWLRSGPDIDSEEVSDSLPFFKTDGTNRVCSGVVHLSKQATNTWVMSFVGGGSPVANLYLGGGSSPTLSGVLTQFQIENDVGNFTGGTFNVSYM